MGQQSVLPPDLRDRIEIFMEKVCLAGAINDGGCPVKGSVSLATSTVALLKMIVTESEWTSAQDLMTLLRTEGKRMIDRAGTADIIVGNLVRRILKLVREDYHSSVDKPLKDADVETAAGTGNQVASAAGGDGETAQATGEGESLHNMLAGGTGAGVGRQQPDYSHHVPDLKEKISQSIEELAMELETGADEISDQALEHIHASEVILTVGRSRTVEAFLKRAATKGRTFQVIVAESAPFYSGHELAASLAKARIQTTVITDSAIFAVMSRVNKVIVGTQSIMADGGLRAASGIYTVAQAAFQYSVPFIVTASMHKLTPRYYTTMNKEDFGCFVSPQEILRGGSGGGKGVANGKMASKIHAAYPLFEYVPPDLVTLFISNMSGHAPSYVYRLLSELYHPDDDEL